MKNIKRVVALFMAVFVSINLFAYDWAFSTGGFLYYYANDAKTELAVWSIDSTMTGDIVIPSSVTYSGKSYRVTEILGFNSGRDRITSVEIPSSITKIWHSALQNSKHLKTIKYNADSCGGDGFSTIYSTRWLDGCDSLETLIIGNNVKYIPDTFAYRSTIKTLKISNGVTKIGKAAFEYCSNLTSVEIPNSVATIGERAFAYCSNLASVKMSNSVTAIEDGAFSNCSNLISVEIPSSVITIGGNAFSDCKSLATLKYNAYSCGGRGFSSDRHWLSGTTKLTEIIIGNEVKYIPDYFLYNHQYHLESVEIPDGVIAIGRSAFALSYIKSIEIPNSVASVGEKAFYGCQRLTKVTIGNGVTTIGKNVFAACRNLPNIEIPNSVTIIQDSAFSYCRTLSSIEIPNSVTSIGKGAFETCNSLKIVKIGEGIDTIYEEAFKECKNINAIYSMAKVPPVLTASNGSQAFADVSTDATVYIPCGGLSYYKAAEYWQNFINMKEDCETDTTSSLDMIVSKDNSTVIYPNPAKDVAVIENAVCNSENIIINVYDAQGKLVMSETKPNAASYTLNTTSLNSGVYYVKVGNATKKLIIE